MYARIKNLIIEKYPYLVADLKSDNPLTSFPLDPLKSAELREYFDIVEVGEKSKPEYSKQTHKCIEKTPVLKEGTWTQAWETKAKTSAEKTLDDSKQWESIRNQRNQKLNETDWQMVKAMETGEDASNLRRYRQKLRDIPQDQKNPFSIIWPPEF
tara:strand:- start:1339 stop:1803 length:465 start_codon:yes stop_codon:yes gene_type:complete